MVIAGEGGSSIYDAETGEGAVQHVGVDDASLAVFDRTSVIEVVAKRRIVIWDARLGEPTSELVGHTAQINQVLAFDGLIASAGNDGSALLWDRVQVARYHHGAPIADAAVTADGKRLVTAGVDSVKVWDLTRRDRLLHLKIAPSDTGSDDERIMWAVTATHAASLEPSMIRMWKLDDDKPVFEHASTRSTTIALARDGAVVVGNRDGTLQIVAASGAAGAPFRAHRGSVISLAFSDDGTRMLSFAFSLADAELYTTDASGISIELAIWDRHTSRELARRSFPIETIGTEREPRFVARHHLLHERETTLLVSSPDLQQSKTLAHDGPVTATAVSADGERIAAASEGAVRIWSLDGREIARLPHQVRVDSIAWSPRGDRLVTGSTDGTLTAWSTTTWSRVAHRQLHERSIFAIAFDPRGEHLASADKGTIHAWTADGLRQIHTMTSASLVTQLVVGDTRLVTSGYDVVEAWRWDSYRDTPAALRAFVACRVALRLDAGRLVRAEPRCDR